MVHVARRHHERVADHQRAGQAELGEHAGDLTDRAAANLEHAWRGEVGVHGGHGVVLSRVMKLQHKACEIGSDWCWHCPQHQMMRLLMLKLRQFRMRTTVTLDDDLVAAAQEYTGIQEKSALVRAALKALVEREAARRLARMGGTAPDLKLTPRRRFK